MKKKSLLVFIICMFAFQMLLPTLKVQAAKALAYWSEETEEVYEPLLPYTLEWSGDVLKNGGFDLDSGRITTDKTIADFVINQYGDIGARKIAELPKQSLDEPINIANVSFPTDGLGYPLTSLKVKLDSTYLIQLDSGDFAKVHIDQVSSSKVNFTFVVQTDTLPDEDPTLPDEDEEEVDVIDLTSSQSSVSMDVGQSKSVSLTAKYSNNSKKTVTNAAKWKSEKPSIASVTKGTIKGVSAGQTIISAEYEGITIKIKVSVKSKTVKPIKGIAGTAVAAGDSHTLVLKKNGTVWSFGKNQTGQLGNGNTKNQYTPVQVKGLKNVKDIAAGYNFSLALKKDGTVWMWGNPLASVYGPRSTPYQIKSLKNVVDIAAGEEHMIALKKDGTVWVWGNNSYGQGGIGKTSPATITNPVKVTKLSKVTEIAGGRYHTLAVKSDGTIWTWGNNERNQIGDGKTGSSLMKNVLVPYQVKLLTKVKSVSGGTYYSLAVKSDGTVWSWGFNDASQLGIVKTSAYQNKPAKVLGEDGEGYLNQIKQADGGYRHTLAVANDGSLYTWGENTYGKLGIGTETSIYDVWSDGANSAVPAKVSLTKVIQAEAGSEHTVAITADGTIWTWGFNDYGQLGVGKKYSKKKVPAKVLRAN
ncbi:hypothetical protein D1953_19785 [Peribacillus asahii]|uniref:BIG2 domain-containing protein n=1 Tax=Peribacillus asahii TaxID=228899 RepID=A0A398AW47_9BACI|nr:hypothetical protein [Peribacillus asahii]RID81832.1 hypothetical protein D1953_19785 [Peribacillus asahii]